MSGWRPSFAALGAFALCATFVVGSVPASAGTISPLRGSSPSCGHPATGVTSTAIKVGAIFPVTGPQGPFFSAVGNGILARFHAQDDSGGISGRKLELVTADDGDGMLANQSAAKFLVSKNVFGVIEASTNSDGGSAYLNQKGIPVTGWGITPAWGRYRNMFGYRYSTSPNPNGEPTTQVASFMKQHGAKRVAVLAGGASASVNFARQIATTLPAFGLTLAYENLAEPLGLTDYSFDAKAMVRAHVDSLVTGLDTFSNIDLFKASAAVGLHFAVGMLPAGYDSRLAAADGTVLAGAYVAIDWRPFELPVPAHQVFKQNLAAVAPTEFPGQLAMVGWLSADAFIRGLQAAGDTCPTRAAFIANLRKVKDYTAGGLLPKTDFSAVFGKEPLCYWEVQFKANALVPASPDPFCGVPFKAKR
ncbi:MAG TPA: ABC transporter substrate-binding protein [Acidimicrobiales bacterium]|nr:ABC transporter substrate-binding protein [Acidimicrobiales bacterium]